MKNETEMTPTEEIATVLWLNQKSLWYVVRNWFKAQKFTGADIARITDRYNTLKSL